jgi:serine/threonine protein kinase
VIDTQKIAGYQILRTLGRNNSGGRVTYLAEKDERQVVIKQFQFAKGSGWGELKELEREISILKSLQHPQIPRYIDSFESEQGFCLVQEYIPAPSLTEVRSRSLEQIQDIGRQLLDILVYLQALHPPVLHRDIKPENVLCNEQGEVFLVDFGFSRLGSAEVAASSMMVGTTGFIPPELFSGREPTKASDLYSLGATLLSLITGTPSTQMDRLLGEDFKFSAAAYDEVDQQYSSWLRKMTAVRVRDRFTDAAAALEGLEPSNNEVDIIVCKIAKKTNYQIFKQSKSLVLCLRLFALALYPHLINFVLVESVKIYLPHEMGLSSIVFISYFMRILYSLSNVALTGGALLLPIFLILDLISLSQKREMIELLPAGD